MNHRLMDHRAMEMVVESQPQSSANGFMEAEDYEANGQGGRYCHQKELLGLRLRRLPETIANPSCQVRRHRYFAHRVPKPAAHIPALLCLLCARRAASEMLYYFEISFRQQFIVDVRIQFRSKILARL